MILSAIVNRNRYNRRNRRRIIGPIRSRISVTISVRIILRPSHHAINIIRVIVFVLFVLIILTLTIRNRILSRVVIGMTIVV